MHKNSRTQNVMRKSYPGNRGVLDIIKWVMEIHLENFKSTKLSLETAHIQLDTHSAETGWFREVLLKIKPIVWIKCQPASLNICDCELPLLDFSSVTVLTFLDKSRKFLYENGFRWVMLWAMNTPFKLASHNDFVCIGGPGCGQFLKLMTG
jgi:hypothetical protein